MAADLPAMLSIAAGSISEAAKYDSLEMRNKVVETRKKRSVSAKRRVAIAGSSYMEDYFRSKVAETPHVLKTGDDVARSMAGIATGICLAAETISVKFVYDEKNNREKQLAEMCERKGLNADDVVFAEDDDTVKKVLGEIDGEVIEPYRAVYSCWKMVIQIRKQFNDCLVKSTTLSTNSRERQGHSDPPTEVANRKRSASKRDDPSSPESQPVMSEDEVSEDEASDEIEDDEDDVSDTLPKAPFQKIQAVEDENTKEPIAFTQSEQV
jgi:hypothetical protein